MSKLTSPRKGKMLSIGRWLFYVNWAKSWDGWGVSQTAGRIDYYTAAILPFSTSSGRGVRFYLWKLAIYVARTNAS